jgi:short-subunit dehydrogenase
MLLGLLVFIAICALFCVALRLAIAIYPWLLREQNIYAKYDGGSVIITGGTDGIGLEIARKLIAQGANAYIVGLETDKINQSELPSGSELVHADLGDPAVVGRMCSWIRANRPALLIHCSGSCVPSNFAECDAPRRYINSHISSLVELTSAFLNVRSSNGGIVFFSSQVAFWTSPFAALYAATKSFTAQFANSIAAEYPLIDVLCLFPGAVNGTSFFGSFPDHWYFTLIRMLGQSPKSVASLVLRALGRVRLLDCGILTLITRIVASFIDDNVINLAGQYAVRSLRKSDSSFDMRL